VIIEEEKEALPTDMEQHGSWKSIQSTVKVLLIRCFVDIGGVDGLIHISELSWTRVKHPSEVLKVGDEVEVTVLEFDKERKKYLWDIERWKTIHGIK